MSKIPDTSRMLVRHRAGHRCERCLMPAPNGQWHHRRRRAVVDDHTHCPCNGVWLCATCHSHLHRNPGAAQADGWIVSAFESYPRNVPITRPRGVQFNDCWGAFTLIA